MADETGGGTQHPESTGSWRECDELLKRASGGLTEEFETTACWREAIRRATAQVAKLLDRREWNYLADVFNGIFADHFTDGPQLALRVRDAIQLGRCGKEWFGPREAEKRAKAVAAKLADMSYAEAWAVIYACRAFWSGPKDHYWQSKQSHAPAKWWLRAPEQVRCDPQPGEAQEGNPLPAVAPGITPEMVEQLRALNYPDVAISRHSLAGAQRIIREGQPLTGVTPQRSPSVPASTAANRLAAGMKKIEAWLRAHGVKAEDVTEAILHMELGASYTGKASRLVNDKVPEDEEADKEG